LELIAEVDRTKAAAERRLVDTAPDRKAVQEAQNRSFAEKIAADFKAEQEAARIRSKSRSTAKRVSQLTKSTIFMIPTASFFVGFWGWVLGSVIDRFFEGSDAAKLFCTFGGAILGLLGGIWYTWDEFRG
jgi:hypothetical protein